MIRKYAEIFCWKNVSSFSHFFSKKFQKIVYWINEMTLNKLVKLTMLWTTGPRIFWHIISQQNSIKWTCSNFTSMARIHSISGLWKYCLHCTDMQTGLGLFCSHVTEPFSQVAHSYCKKQRRDWPCIHAGWHGSSNICNFKKIPISSQWFFSITCFSSPVQKYR